jgi:hypothetical protein
MYAGSSGRTYAGGQLFREDNFPKAIAQGDAFDPY